VTEARRDPDAVKLVMFVSSASMTPSGKRSIARRVLDTLIEEQPHLSP
jgi:hypothetical protein